MKTKENLERLKTEEAKPPKKKTKITKDQQRLSETQPKTINDLAAETLENVFHFLDIEDLRRVTRVCQFWQGASNRVRARKFSSLLRIMDQEKTTADEALNYLNQLGKFAVNVPGSNNRYAIDIEEEQNLLQPSLLHDLAEWQPHKEDLEAYSEIFHKLLELGADPNAVCTLEHIKNSEVVNTTEESVLERALKNVNVPLIFLLLELYPSEQLIVNDADMLLEKIIDDFVYHDEFSETGEEQMLKHHRKSAEACAKIFNKMIDCGFEPGFATIKKYFAKKIQIPTASPSTVRDLNFLLLSLYPGEEKEEMLKELQTTNSQLKEEIDSLKKQVEIAKQQLVALKQAKETGKDEEIAELSAAQL